MSSPSPRPIFIQPTTPMNPALSGVSRVPLLSRSLGNFAMSDEEYAAMIAAGDSSGGSVAKTQAAAAQYQKATGGGGMNFLSIFGNMFGGGAKTGSDPVAQALAAGNQRSSTGPIIIAVAGLGAVGLLVFLATRK